MKTSVYQSTLLAFVWVTFNSLVQAGTVAVEHGGGVGSVEIRRETGQFTVFGVVNRGVAAHRVPGAHVHVLLVDGQGKVIDCKSATLPSVSPRRDAALNRRAAYSVNFPSGEFAGVAKVRVEYLALSHKECSPQKASKPCSEC